MSKIAYLFPGQGSQHPGMGKQLFDLYPSHVKLADKILGYSIKDLCLNGKDKISLSKYTQPALFIVNALSFFNFIDSKQAIPDYVAGHSLGEYNALLASGVIDFEAGLHLVKKRAALMQNSIPGAMSAILNISLQKLTNFIHTEGLTVDIANHNSFEQFVISGLKNDILLANQTLSKIGAKVIPLNVSGAFHSRHMQKAGKEFSYFLQNIYFSKGEIPVVANITGQPYTTDDFATKLSQHIYSTVKWHDSMLYLLNQGCNQFHEIGPGNVLQKLIKKYSDTIEA